MHRAGFFWRSRRVQHAVAEDVETGDRGASRRSDRVSVGSASRDSRLSIGEEAAKPASRDSRLSVGEEAAKPASRDSRLSVSCDTWLSDQGIGEEAAKPASRDSRLSASTSNDSADSCEEARRICADFLTQRGLQEYVVEVWVWMKDIPKIDSYEEQFTLPTSFSLHVEVKNVVTGSTALEKEFDCKNLLEGQTRTHHENLELQAFPFDVQRLHVDTKFSFDEDEVKEIMLWWYTPVVNRSNLGISHKSEWKLERQQVEIYSWLIPSSTGYDLHLTTVITVRRLPWFYLLNIMVPAACIVVFAFLSFWFHPSQLSERLQVTLTMVLTLVAFKLSVSSSKYVPCLGYLTLMDMYMFSGFLVVALVALQNYLSAVVHDSAPWWDNASAWALIAAWGGDAVERKKDNVDFRPLLGRRKTISYDELEKLHKDEKRERKLLDLMKKYPVFLMYPEPSACFKKHIENLDVKNIKKNSKYLP
eukprot:366405-Chlamydomonas_euryale.AAC.7